MNETGAIKVSLYHYMVEGIAIDYRLHGFDLLKLYRGSYNLWHYNNAMAIPNSKSKYSIIYSC